MDLDGKTIGMGIGGGVIGALLVGVLLNATSGNGVDSLQKNMASQFETIDTKLRSLVTKTGTVDVVTGKLTELEKSLSSKVSELKTASSSQISGVVARIKDLEAKKVGELKAALSSQISGVEARIKDLKAEIAKLIASQRAAQAQITAMKASVEKAQAKVPVAKNAPSSSTKSSTENSGNIDSVRLAIAQSSWLVKNKLNVALSYIYPGEDKVRIGIGDKVMDLTKGAPEEFMFEGKRCNVLFDGVIGDKALISHACPS